MEIVEGGVSVALTTIQSSTGELISLAEAFAWPGAAGEEADMADLPTPQDAYRFITNPDEVDLTRFRVIGPDACCHEGTRNALQDARQKILPGLMSTGHKRKKHLMLGGPRRRQEQLRPTHSCLTGTRHPLRGAQPCGVH